MRWILSRLRPVASAGVVTFVIVAAGVGVWPSIASAHAALLSVDPANGTVVAASPPQVVLTFSEHVSLTGGDVRVLDDTGGQVSGDASSVADTVVVPIPADLANGTFTVSYQVISADSHRIAGATVFHVGAPSLDAPVQGAPNSGEASWPLTLAAVLAGFVGYALVLGSVGLWWFLRFVVGPPAAARVGEAPSSEFPVGDADGIATRLAGLAIAVLVAWTPLRIARTLGSLGGLSDTDVLLDELRGPLGVAALVTVAGLSAMLVMRRLAPTTWRAVILPLAGFVALAGFAVEGHTRSQQPRWLMVGFDLVHLVAGAMWLGGVVGLVIGFRRSTSPVAAWSAVVSRFSSLAAILVLLVATAGTGMAWIVLPNRSAITGSGYGQTLIGKVALVAIVLVLAAYNRWRLVPRVGTGNDAVTARFARTLLAELLVLLAVLCASALLVTRSPVSAVSGGSSGAADRGIVTHAMLSSGGHAVISFDPGAVGSNTVRVQLLDVSGEPLVPAQPPDLELVEPELEVGPLRPAADPVEVDDGVYDVQLDVPIAATWQVDVGVRVGEFDVSNGSTTVRIAEAGG